MNIQYINIDIWGERNIKFKNHNFSLNNFSVPFSLDGFDINMIDLNGIWDNLESEKITDINVMNDLDSLKEMIINSKKTKFILVCPYNQKYNYKEEFLGEISSKTKMLKDIIHEFSKIINFLLPDKFNVDLIYEKTKTLINKEKTLIADFYFGSFSRILTKSSTDKITTIKLDDKFYVTTLNFCFGNNSFEENVIRFLEKIELIKNENPIPEWIYSMSLFDDKEQKNKIKNQNEIILNAQREKEKAQEILKENLYYKSSLYASGDNLVEVVFKILEIILNCDLSSFKDEKREDFLIRKSNITFIGEIKGVNGSIKNANISQLDVHYNGYLDKLYETNEKENVKALLIINPNRERPIEKREKVHQNQIDLAIRNGSLIIQTYDLLKIFEAFKQNKINSVEIENIFMSNTGVLEYNKVLKK